MRAKQLAEKGARHLKEKIATVPLFFL